MTKSIVTDQVWKSVLTLDSSRRPISGSEDELAGAIRRGADLRIYTEFRNNEHLDPNSQNDELVQEVSEFRVTYLIDDQWTAGIMTFRQPISLPDGFDSSPSMSFFMYNQNGQQAIARPHFDGQPATGVMGPAKVDDFHAMPKYRQSDNWDAGTNAPSHNFIYDFGVYRFCVRDDWQEVFAHTSDGKVISGSLEALRDQFSLGAEVKLAIRGLCDDLDKGSEGPIDHELFVQAGPCYYYTRRKLFIAGSHPLVRVRPAIPMKYESRNWDCGWLMTRTDGLVSRRLVDPYTLKFTDSQSRHAIRWFAR